jgi:hypothetical protein
METFLKYRLDAGVAPLEMDDGKTNAMSVPLLGLWIPRGAGPRPATPLKSVASVCRPRTWFSPPWPPGRARRKMVSRRDSSMKPWRPSRLLVHAHAVRMRRLDAESFAATKQRLRRPFLDALGRAIDEDIADWSSRFLQPRQS